MRTVTVIGAGPAGMMASIAAAAAGAEVTLLEKNEKTGKKLYITGKGRCNLTNACSPEEFLENVVTNAKFLYSAIYGFTPADTISFFEDAGLALKTERGRRVFPASNRSSDVIKTLEKEMKKAGVRVRLCHEVKSLKEIDSDAVIIACGGLSYPQTGSTGDGYAFAKEAGHSIIQTFPSLTAICVSEPFVKELEGLSLKNVAVRICNEDKKTLFEDFGELLFTDSGISGPVILTASARLGPLIDEAPKSLRLFIDLKPALDCETLDKRILRDFEENKNRQFKNSLSRLLPSKIIAAVISLSGIDPAKRVNCITRQERRTLADTIKNFPLTLEKMQGYERAVVTKGGVCTGEIRPDSMRSRLDPRIYFAGEVIDVDALTGGYNIQIALSTGYLAGKSAAKEETWTI